MRKEEKIKEVEKMGNGKMKLYRRKVKFAFFGYDDRGNDPLLYETDWINEEDVTPETKEKYINAYNSVCYEKFEEIK
jgi:hypothetical protein